MKRRMFALLLALLWVLPGCSAAEPVARALAEDIAGQLGEQYGTVDSSPARAEPQPPQSTADTEALAKEALRAYDAILEPYQQSNTAQSLTADIDEDGIAELILVTDEFVTVGTGSEQFETMRMVYSVYTYGSSGMKTLISQRETHAAPAAGSYITIGIDRIDDVPVVVAMSLGETTGNQFGDYDYQGKIDVEAIDPFTGKLYSVLYQELSGSRVIAQRPSSLSAEVSRYKYVSLDSNGVIVFQPVLASQRLWYPDLEPQAAGSNNGPAEIRTAADLEKLRTDPDGDFVLTQDITLSSSGFRTIEKFNGTLDGQGHCIRNICIRAEGQTASGLFDYIGEDAVVDNLCIEVTAELSISLPTMVAGLANCNGGTVRSCMIRSDVRFSAESGGSTFMLGYAPVASDNYGTIEGCTLETNATAIGPSNVNGIVSENGGKITGCLVKITGNGCNCITGLAYRNWNDVSSCTVSVVAENIGGFICVASQNHAAVRYCYFFARLTPRVGERAHWLIGSDEADGSFDSTNNVYVEEVENEADHSTGSGTQSDPYRLREPADLEMMRSEPDAYYRLVKDIDFDGAVFSPLGEFGGVLDGSGHTISNVSLPFVSGKNNKASAFIRNLTKTGIVENLTIECTMDAKKTEKTDGAGITIRNEGTVRNCTVTLYAKNCYAVGGITRNNTVSGTIEDCTVNLTTENCSFVGGIAEYQSGTLSDCTADIEVTNATCLGGVAYVNAGKISSCTAGGTLRSYHGGGYLAGLVGENIDNGTITASKAQVRDAVTGKNLASIGNQ